MNKNLISYYIDAFEKLPRKAKELLFEEDALNENVIWGITECMDYINSPIEQILLTALCIYQEKKNKKFYFDVQKEIVVEDKKYIVDFYVSYDSVINHFMKENFKLAIECDGFEYHHSTKEQVNYDYKRENDLRLNGYDVIRFTGSQIYSDPIGCAKQIVEYIKLKGLKKNE